MADRFPGGVISKTPPTVVAPVDGEGGSASGVWTLDEQLGLQKAGAWPKKVLPRELYTWGVNSFGQLGDNSTVGKQVPTQVGLLTDWVQVSSGTNHTVCLKLNGTLFAWGNNNVGELGIGGSGNSFSSPVQIGALTNWAQVSVGAVHTACVKTDGTLWTWGDNAAGRLGLNINPAVDRSSPTQVGALSNWAQVSAGTDNTLCVTTSGTLFSWGNGAQVGDGTVIDRSSPVQIGALTNWAVPACGQTHSLCTTTNGTLFSWGANNAGMLGDGTIISKSSPVQIGALTTWSLPAAGGCSACITTEGTLFTWGPGVQTGLNVTTQTSSPVQVGALTNWAQISVGTTHSHAVKTDGTLWAWGVNTNGRLGIGNTVNKSSPTQVGALTNWSNPHAWVIGSAILKG